MANVIYTRFFQQIASGGVDFDAAGTVVKCRLERSTSTYTPNKDHDFLSDVQGAGWVEISVTSYPAANGLAVANKAVNIDDANDRVELTFDNVNFGNLESGQTVKGLLFYVETGGSAATPSDDPLICYIDTATGLPAVLGGGQFLITINAEGIIQFAQG